jgi:hypothetical protein
MQEERALDLAPKEIASEKKPSGATPLAEFSYRLQWFEVLFPFGSVASGIWNFFVHRHISELIFAVVHFLTFVRTSILKFCLRDCQYYVFPEGLALIQRDKMTAFLWEEIDTIEQKANENLFRNFWSFVIKGYGLRFLVTRRDGAQFTFTDLLPKYEKLWEIIQQQTLPVLLEQALKDYRAGQTVRFGPVRLHLVGVSHGRKSLAWSDLQEIVITDKMVLIREKDRWWPWFKACTTQIPNVHVFRSMTEIIQRELSHRTKDCLEIGCSGR